MRELEQQKMKERIEWSFETLKTKAKKEDLKVSDDTLFVQACEMARALFIRSEIQYSNKN